MTSTPAQPPIIAIVGPTATGKSALGLAIAERLGAEVVNADAMALYRGMDIGTAKVTLAERRGIPHNQLDVLEPWEKASVAAYQQSARADLAAIADRGHRAVLVGGSGLYVRAALDALDIPPTDAVVREALEAELAADGPAPLVARLTAQDPTAAATIDPRNLRRVVRALEVIALTGRPFSASMPTRSFVAPTVVLGLSADLAILDDRIASRTATMWARGMTAEVAALRADSRGLGKTARTAIGYAQALAQLDGVLTETEAIDATATATRRLVRRQRSWFNPDPRICWLDADDPAVVEAALATITAGDAIAGAAGGDNG